MMETLISFINESTVIPHLVFDYLLVEASSFWSDDIMKRVEYRSSPIHRLLMRTIKKEFVLSRSTVESNDLGHLSTHEPIYVLPSISPSNGRLCQTELFAWDQLNQSPSQQQRTKTWIVFVRFFSFSFF
jgi:hypothetical protein